MFGNKSVIVLYIWGSVIISIAVIYFVIAYGEYSDLIELLSYGIHGETLEKQIEIALFLGSGFVYLGLFAWIIKVRLKQKAPYLVSIIVSLALIITYIASRTIGVPIVGTELYIGKLDIISKILQILIVHLGIATIVKVTRLQQRIN